MAKFPRFVVGEKVYYTDVHCKVKDFTVASVEESHFTFRDNKSGEILSTLDCFDLDFVFATEEEAEAAALLRYDE